MPEPFKNLFNEDIIRHMAECLSQAWPAFNTDAFITMAVHRLDDLELKERATQITNALSNFLPDDYEQAAAIMRASLAPDMESDKGIKGWAIMPMANYIGLYGLKHFDLSMGLLKEMTKLFTAEFAVRFFLIAEPERSISSWLGDPSHHVRRLISEGTRPRLPWAMRLPDFVTDPGPILPLLEALKDDDEEYVRRSVANNLNDIAKDHPDIVADIAKKWLVGADKNRQKLIRHACRTLIKQGHQKTLKALGYGPPHVTLENLEILTPHVDFGTALVFQMSLASCATHPQNLIIDYAIHHRKANGTTSPKVFKWKVITLKPFDTLKAKRKHAIRKITTRVYYPGEHHLEIFVNGVSLGRYDFHLTMA